MYWDLARAALIPSFSLLLLCSQAVGRRHFGCPSLGGVEVENQGGSGTALSHWEKRILEVKQLTYVALSKPNTMLHAERRHDWGYLIKSSIFCIHICTSGRQRVIIYKFYYL